MRTIQSFILRLLVDSDRPDTLHGSLHRVTDEYAQPFMNERDLLVLLCHLTAAGQSSSPTSLDTLPSGDE
jgi:hypothetical protein